MAEHTSGPWQLHSPTEGDPITGDGSYCITGPGGGVIADIVPKDWHETPGNARLIASAPELLEALEALVRIAEDDHYKCDLDSDEDCVDVTDTDSAIEYLHGAIRGAKAAIANVTGGE
jgi:hypothetical protein